MTEVSPNRRNFLKQSAIAATAVSTVHILTSKSARAARPIKVGLIGCGGRGKAAAENAIRAAMDMNDEVQITALADVFPQKIKEAKERLAKSENMVNDDLCFTGFDAYKKIMETDVDYVILTTPPVFRPQMLEAAVAAGKHVFMEKPAAVDSPGIRRIIAAGESAKKKGLTIVAGTQRRHEASYVDTVKRLQDGAIGAILSARAVWCTGCIKFTEKKSEWSEMEYQIRNWYHFLWLSGDHLVEQHVHNLDVISWVLGKYPVRAYGQGGRAWQQRGNIWDHHQVDYTYGNGIHLMSMASQIERPDSKVEEWVIGDKGVSNCKDWIQWNDGKSWKWEGRYTNPYIQEHADLIDSIRHEKGINEAESCAKSTMVAILGRMAEYSGRDLTWDEAFQSDETLGLPDDEYKLGPMPLRPVPVPGGMPYTGKEGWDNDPLGRQP